jgi:hypothetical protein
LPSQEQIWGYPYTSKLSLKVTASLRLTMFSVENTTWVWGVGSCTKNMGTNEIVKLILYENQ